MTSVLCLGPTGVGKTLMLRTLARVLEVPFSMSVCFRRLFSWLLALTEQGPIAPHSRKQAMLGKMQTYVSTDY